MKIAWINTDLPMTVQILLFIFLFFSHVTSMSYYIFPNICTYDKVALCDGKPSRKSNAPCIPRRRNLKSNEVHTNTENFKNTTIAFHVLFVFVENSGREIKACFNFFSDIVWTGPKSLEVLFGLHFSASEMLNISQHFSLQIKSYSYIITVAFRFIYRSPSSLHAELKLKWIPYSMNIIGKI